MSDDLLSQLEVAKRQLASFQAAWDNYSGNNPNKYQADIASAQADVSRITKDCKRLGLLPRTEQENLWALLDAAHPNAQSRQVVKHGDAFYMKKFKPVSTSLSGKTVKEWDPYWDQLPPTDAAVLEFLKPAPTAVEAQVVATLKRIWPFKRPAGGIVFDIQTGPESQLSAESKDVTVGFRKGHAERRKGLAVRITAPEAILAELANTTAGQPLVIGFTESGQRKVIKHKGASFDGLFIHLE